MALTRTQIIDYVMYWHNLLVDPNKSQENVILQLSGTDLSVPLLHATPESVAFAESLLFVLRDIGENHQTSRSVGTLGLTRQKLYKVNVDALIDKTDRVYSIWNMILVEAISRVDNDLLNFTLSSALHERLPFGVKFRLHNMLSPEDRESLNLNFDDQPDHCADDERFQEMTRYWLSLTNPNADRSNPHDMIFFQHIYLILKEVMRDYRPQIRSFPVNSAGELHRYSITCRDIWTEDQFNATVWKEGLLPEALNRMERIHPDFQYSERLYTYLPEEVTAAVKSALNAPDITTKFTPVCPADAPTSTTHCFRRLGFSSNYQHRLPSDSGPLLPLQDNTSAALFNPIAMIACAATAIGLFLWRRKSKQQKPLLPTTRQYNKKGF